MGLKLRHAKFQQFSARGTFRNWGLIDAGGKFNGKLTISRNW